MKRPDPMNDGQMNDGQTNEGQPNGDHSNHAARECATLREHLPLFAGGDLDARATTRVETHLERCGGCRERVEALRRAFDAYFAVEHGEAARELTGRSLWPDLRAQLRGETAAADGRVGARSSGGGAAGAAQAWSVGSWEGGVDEDAGDASADGTLELELAGAGRIDAAGVRGSRVLAALAGGIGLAAAAVLLQGVLWQAPGAGDAESGGREVGAPATTVADGGGADAEGGVHRPAGAERTDGALSEGLAAGPEFDPALIDAPSGLVPIRPEDDGERLIHGAPVRVRTDPGTAGAQLAGDSSGWR